jgi:hypothetical protein
MENHVTVSLHTMYNLHTCKYFIFPFFQVDKILWLCGVSVVNGFSVLELWLWSRCVICHLMVSDTVQYRLVGGYSVLEEFEASTFRVEDGGYLFPSRNIGKP